MMRIRLSWPCLSVALLGSAAMAVSAAAQAPEFGRCVQVAKYTGKFSSNCGTETTRGSYEWVPGPGAANGFTTSGGTSVFPETLAGKTFTCEGEHGTGQYTGAKTVADVVMRLTGCKSSGLPATTPGEPTGTVVLGPLEGGLGVTKLGRTAKMDKIGLDLFPSEPGGLVADFRCYELRIEVRGSVISEALTANKMELSSALKFKQKNGEQKPEAFEGQPKDVLEANFSGSGWEQSGLELDSTLSNEEALEVNPVQ